MIINCIVLENNTFGKHGKTNLHKKKNPQNPYFQCNTANYYFLYTVTVEKIIFHQFDIVSDLEIIIPKFKLTVFIIIPNLSILYQTINVSDFV